MYYQKSSSDSANDQKKEMIIDFRSDTLTKPTKEMREAMFNADVGDDVFNEDPTVKKLQEAAAKMIGMEDSLFVSSGTMGNLIAIMNHCDVRGSEAYCGDSAHCLLCEQTGASQIAGVNLRAIRNNVDGSFDLRELKSKLRRNRDHEPISKLVLTENTFNGKIVPLRWLEELVSLCKERNMKLHMDGARLWNASVASGVPAAKIVSGFDSVSFCLSKGLGAPVGSLLCGSTAFIANARRIRKVLGGGMRQVGVLAAAGLVALRHIPNLANDHKKALVFACAINEVRSSRYSVDLSTVQTNMVFVDVNSKVADAETFVRCLQDEDEDKIIVKCLALSDSRVRFVFSREITDDGLALAIKKITRVIRKLDVNL